jgi:predicted DNA-binding transcriptional regulator YafY
MLWGIGMPKFDLNDVVLTDLLRRDVWMSTRQLLERLEKAGKADPLRRTLTRRLNFMRDELGWIESREMSGDRKAFEWRRTNAVDKIKVSDGPGQALALKLLKRFSDKKMPPVVVHSLEPFFAAAGDALEKFESHVPSISRYAAWERKIATVSAGFPVSEPLIQQHVYDAVAEALFDEQTINILHRPGYWDDAKHRVPPTETILPLGLVESDGCLYLVAIPEQKRDEPVMYRLDQVSLADANAGPGAKISRPRGFSLEKFISEERAFDLFDRSPDGKIVEPREIVVELRFSDNSFWHLQNREIGAVQVVTPLPQGKFHVQARVTNSRKLRWWLRTFGQKVEVLGPPALRQRIRDDAAAVAALYSDASPQTLGLVPVTDI